MAEASRDGESLAAYDALIARDDIDAVYIPLPNHLHAEWTSRAIATGKHVLCEKPLTLSVADSEALFDQAAAAGVVVMEAYMWPHHDRARRVLSLVRSGDLGWLQHGHSEFCWPMDLDGGDHRLDLRGAGALFDLGIYTIAPFMMMAGRDAVEVAANAVRNRAGVDISMSGWVDWGAGFGSSFHVSFDAPHVRSMALAGSEGLVEMPGYHVPGPRDENELIVSRRDGEPQQHVCGGGDAFAEMVQHFVDVVAGDCLAIFGRTESLRLANVLQRLHAATAR